MKMDDGELQGIVRTEIEDAITFIDTEIGGERRAAIDFYHGRPFGDEEEGRSQVVSRDVHDTVNAILPSLMRIFFGAENVVEFAPQGEEDVEQAEQATDYVNYVVTNDNDGFGVFYAAIKDALRSKVGFIKYWWDDSITVSTKTYTGLDEMALTALIEDLDKAEKYDLVSSSQDENGTSITIRLKTKQDRARIAAVPPEELLISRDAVCMDSARLVAHRTNKSVSDLVAMGYKKEDIEEAATSSDELETNQERQARNPYVNGDWRSDDRTVRQLLYIEAYPYVDFDGDGIAELRKVCTVGPGYKIVSNEPWDERPFADLHCDPEPHTFFGQSLADKTMDVQRIKSVVMRAGLDSLAQSIFPRTVVVENDGNTEDAMNTEVGAILRARSPTGYVSLPSADLSSSALPYLSYMDELRENRTGMSKVSMGLDAEALQNTTAAASEAQFTRSQERIELVARIMASGVRRLFRGILRLVGENQRAARMVKLRNKWTPINPSAWRTNMDVICTFGLGGGSNQQKAQLLALVAQKQEMIFQTAGLENPIVSGKQYFNTLSKILELGGFKNPDAYFTDPESEEAQANAPAEPPPNPEMEKVKGQLQLEQAKAQSQAQLAMQKHQMDAEAAQRKAEQDHQARIMEIQSAAELKRWETEQTLQLKRETTEAELGMKRELLMAELEMKRETAYLNAEVARETGMAKAEASSSVSDVQPGGDPG